MQGLGFFWLVESKHAYYKELLANLLCIVCNYDTIGLTRKGEWTVNHIIDVRKQINLRKHQCKDRYFEILLVFKNKVESFGVSLG